MPELSESESLQRTVIDGGYCIGCGACSAMKGSPFTMRFDEKGQYKAFSKSAEALAKSQARTRAVCPFADGNPNEDVLSAELFKKDCAFDEKIGYYKGVFAGHIADRELRIAHTSGGFSTWLLKKMLEKKLIDGVFHVIKTQDTNALFRFSLSTTTEQLLKNNAKSAYYPVEMSEALTLMREKKGKYAIIAVPSFVKALRLLCKEDTIFADRIAFCIGIISGHLKSKHYADLLASQIGMQPGEITGIDFRRKQLKSTAKMHATEMWYETEKGTTRSRVVPSANLFGVNWGLGLMKYLADDYSDDVIGETADVSIGDAWIPRYVKDGAGNNIIVTRHPIIHALVEEGIRSKELVFDALEPEEAYLSQKAGYRHRREGLACRVNRKKREKKWHPPTRVPLDVSRVSPQRIKVYESREDIGVGSHQAFIEAAAGKFSFPRLFFKLHNGSLRYGMMLKGKICIQTVGQMYWSVLCYVFRWKVK